MGETMYFAKKKAVFLGNIWQKLWLKGFVLFARHQKGAEALFRTFLLAGNRCLQGFVAALEIGIAHRSKRGVGPAPHLLQKGFAGTSDGFYKLLGPEMMKTYFPHQFFQFR
jgi:hypothetical protein